MCAVHCFFFETAALLEWSAYPTKLIFLASSRFLILFLVCFSVTLVVCQNFYDELKIDTYRDAIEIDIYFEQIIRASSKGEDQGIKKYQVLFWKRKLFWKFQEQILKMNLKYLAEFAEWSKGKTKIKEENVGKPKEATKISKNQ